MVVLKKFTLGSAQTNCYLIKHEKEIILVDAPEDIEKVIDYMNDKQIILEKVILTHTHYDHIAGLKLLEEKFNIMIYVSKQEMNLLKNKDDNLANLFNKGYTYDKIVYDLNEAKINKMEIRYISGHSLNSAVFIFKEENTIFSGDTLFRNTIGRSDLKFGNMQKLITGIKSELLTLGNEYDVYPGHGFKTTIKYEKENNQFL